MPRPHEHIARVSWTPYPYPSLPLLPPTGLLIEAGYRVAALTAGDVEICLIPPWNALITAVMAMQPFFMLRRQAEQCTSL
jgi:hypothetical protein